LKLILLFEKAQQIVISIKIQHGPFYYNFVGAVGHELLGA